MSGEILKSYSLALLFVLLPLLNSCNSENKPDWQVKNDQLIEELNLEVTELPEVSSGIEPSMDTGNISNLTRMDSLELHPGITAKIFWGRGVLASIINLRPKAKLPLEKLPEDRLLFVLKGAIELNNGVDVKNMLAIERESPDGSHSKTPRMDFIFQEKNSVSEITAAETGARLIEVYSPIRLDYLKMMGEEDIPDQNAALTKNFQASITANKIYDLFEVQLTEISEGAFARLVNTPNMQLSFLSLAPKSTSPGHIHPQEQLTLVRRGSLNQTIIKEHHQLGPNDVLYVPGNVVHSSTADDMGADLVDIFWPVREDYLQKQQHTSAAYQKIIPQGAKPELVIDGAKTEPSLTFSEGPKWMNGKIYFSNMFFDQQWNADPKKSSIVELSPDGTYRNITEGKMQANGLYPYKNGNLLVCDMIGHRILEMTTDGKIVRVVADSYEGKPIDGPNDIITDSKGGIYFTDPQFTMEEEKYQPGRAVYYISKDAKITRLVEPNEFAMPNGILLSPDGKTLYINNCFDDESWYPVDSEKDNFIWAYDVNEDGSIGNGRKFAEVLLTDIVLERKGRSSGADGMAIDKMGNLYVATYYGVQIFDNEGSFIGMINLPSYPVSLCFGGEDMKTLYIVSYDKVYKIKTLMEGYVNYL